MKKIAVLVIIIAVTAALFYTLKSKQELFQIDEKNIESIEIVEQDTTLKNNEIIENNDEISKKSIEVPLYPATVKVSLNKKSIESNNKDRVNFTVEVFDQYDEKMHNVSINDIELYINNKKITGDSFKTSEKGEYSVYAKYKSIYSNQVGFIAIQKGLFKDKNLEKEIRKVLGKPNEEITIEDLKKIPVLTIEYKKIKQLDGIEYMTELKELKLTGNEIVDVSPLSKLKKLEKLWLDENKIRIVDPLLSLENIHYLELGNNEIRNIKPLSNMLKIKKLYLYDNQISDIRAIVNLNELIEFYIWDNPLEKSSDNIFRYFEKKSCKVYK